MTFEEVMMLPSGTLIIIRPPTIFVSSFVLCVGSEVFMVPGGELCGGESYLRAVWVLLNRQAAWIVGEE